MAGWRGHAVHRAIVLVDVRAEPAPEPEHEPTDRDTAGLFQVTYTSSDSAACPTGAGADKWSYYSTVTGNTTTLCLNRIRVRNYCVLAQQSGDVMSSIAASTAVDCRATRVPAPYNQDLIIAGVYQAPPGANVAHRRTSARDYPRYWSLLADGGNTLVCFTYPA